MRKTRRYVARSGKAVLAAVAALSVSKSALGAADSWKTAATGVWAIGTNWVDGTTPGVGDTANFNLPGSYTVTFNAVPTDIQNLSFSQGTVTMVSSGGAKTLGITAAGGGQDLNVSGANTGLTLGSNSNPMSLNIGDELSVQSDATVTAQFGSHLTAHHLAFPGMNGMLRIDGATSTLSLTGNTNQRVAAGGNGTLIFQNGSTGSTIAGTLDIASSPALSNGVVSVIGGSFVSLTGNLDICRQNTLASTGALNISGSNSIIVQTGIDGVTVGSGGPGAATINIGIASSGGTLVTGNNGIFIDSTGTVRVGTAANAGVLASDGNIFIYGGGSGSGLIVGSAGSLIFEVARTMTVTNAGQAMFQGSYSTPASTAYQISGSGSKFTVANTLVIDNAASFNVSSGAQLSLGAMQIGISDFGTLSVDGAGSSVSVTGATYFGQMTQSGGVANFSNAAVGTFTGGLYLGLDPHQTYETLNVKSGAHLTTASLSIGSSPDTPFSTGPSAIVTLTDAGSSVGLLPNCNLSIGDTFGSVNTVNVLNNAMLTVGNNGATNLYPGSTLTINGGTVDLKTLNANGATINFTAGALSYIGSLSVGIGGLLGSDLTLLNNRILTVSGTTTIDAFRSLTLSGGTLNTGSLIVNGNFNFNSGNLGITGANGLRIGAGGPLGSNLDLGAGKNLNVTNTVLVDSGALLVLENSSGFNAGSLLISSGGELALNGVGATATVGIALNGGLIRGEGRILASSGFINSIGAETRAEAGKRVQVQSTFNNNLGLIALQGGVAEFSGPLTNSLNAQITGHGTIKTAGTGLTNNGTINLSGGSSDVYGPVVNNTRITITGGGTTTFYQDVNTSNGSINVGTNTTAVFFGAVTGTGGSHFGGAGIKDFEGTLNGPPVNSVVGDTYVGTTANVSTAYFNEDDVQISGAASVLPNGSNTGVSRVHTLSFLDNGKLDLNDNDLIVDYTGASPLQAIRSKIIVGRTGGTWQGNQLTSSAARQQALFSIHPTALGYAEASTLGITVFGGQSVDPTSVLVRYTYVGDANLDGVVNALDFNAVANNFGAATNKLWSDADFNFDGLTNTSDFVAMANNFGLVLLPSPPVLGSLVPEPATVLFPVLLLGGFRRHRKADLIRT